MAFDISLHNIIDISSLQDSPLLGKHAKQMIILLTFLKKAHLKKRHSTPSGGNIATQSTVNILILNHKEGQQN